MFVLARSTSSEPGPESTASRAKSAKPFACSRVMAGGMASAWRSVATSRIAGPSWARNCRTAVGQVLGSLDTPSPDAERVADRGEVRVDQVGGEVHEAGGLHLELDEVQRGVVEDHHLHRQVLWISVTSSPSIMVKPPSPASATTCRPGVGGLHADRLWDRVGHRAVVERADQPAPAVHPQLARGPHDRRPDIGDEHRVVVGGLVEKSNEVLRVDRRRPPAGR